MHILYLQQLLVLPGTPGNNRCFEMARQWVKAGYKISFISSNAGIPASYLPEAPSYPYHFQLEGIDIYLVDSAYSHMMSFPRRVLSFLSFYRKALGVGKRLRGINKILAYSPPLSVAVLGEKLSRYHKRPLLLELADVWPDVPIGMGIIKHPLLANYLRRRTQRIYQHAEHIAVFSEGQAEQVQSHGIPTQKISVIHNGSNPEQFPAKVSTPPKESVKLIYTGTLGKANGVSQLIYAMQKIEVQGHRHIHLDIIGQGQAYQQVRELAQALHVQQVHFFAQLSREEMAEKLQQADIGLISFAPFPVLEANGATKFFDYLFSGIPIALNYQGWQAEYLAAHQCGVSAPQGNVDAFVEQLLFLSKSPRLREEMGKRGRKLAEDRFDRKDLASRYIALFKA